MAVTNATAVLEGYGTATIVYVAAGSQSSPSGYNIISFARGTDALGTSKSLKVAPGDLLFLWCNDSLDPPLLFGTGIADVLESRSGTRGWDYLAAYKVTSTSNLSMQVGIP